MRETRRKGTTVVERCAVAHMMGPSGFGGVETYVHSLVRKCLPEFRHIVYLKQHAKAWPFFQDSGIECRTQKSHPPVKTNPLGALKAVRSVAREFRELGIGMVHGHCLGGYRAGALPAFVCRVPAVWHVHIPPSGALPWQRKLQLRSCRLAICISEFVRRSVQSQLPWLDARVVYGGIDVGDFQPQRPASELRNELGIPSDSVVVGMVANFGPECKNQLELLEAAKHLAEFANIYYVFVGSKAPGADHYETFQRALGKSPVRNRVRMTGFRRDVADVMNAFDMAVHTADGEGFGLVVPEAMSLSKPVIGANSGALPELIRHGQTGFLYDLGKPAQLARYILLLAQDREMRSRTGNAAKEDTTRRFSMPRYARDIKKLYTEVLRI